MHAPLYHFAFSSKERSIVQDLERQGYRKPGPVPGTFRKPECRVISRSWWRKLELSAFRSSFPGQK